MKRVFVGVDISKAWFDFYYRTSDDQKSLKSERLDNNPKGISALIRQLLKRFKKEDIWICFEHTGNYGLLLASMLQSEEITYSVVPAMEVKKSLGITRGKSDEIDAKRLAEYAFTFKHKIKPSELPAEELMQVKNLLSYRAQLVKMKTQLTNSLKSYQTASNVINLDFICKDLKKKIDGLDKDIKKLDQSIEMLIATDESLKKNYQLIKSVKGIGLVLAACMIVHTNNFSSFDDPRKFNCYTGLAPFQNSSGIKNGKTRTSHYRHKYLKTLLFSGANSAAIHDPQLRHYYTRKKEEGKAHQTIINAVACKLVYRAFATIKRQSPYVNLQH
tara:strand:- start:30 stop:1019 length:990 start_codon:yes stop_codon:yes gene_type:complete